MEILKYICITVFITALCAGCMSSPDQACNEVPVIDNVMPQGKLVITYWDDNGNAIEQTLLDGDNGQEIFLPYKVSFQVRFIGKDNVGIAGIAVHMTLLYNDINNNMLSEPMELQKDWLDCALNERFVEKTFKRGLESELIIEYAQFVDFHENASYIKNVSINNAENN